LQRAKSTSDIQKISKIVMIASLGHGSKDPFWNLAGENLISLFSQYLIKHSLPEFRTLANVHHLLTVMTYAPEKIDKLFVSCDDTALLSEYKAYMAYGDKTLASIIATCRTALSLFASDPGVALITSHDTIDFSEFRNKKVALFINTSTKDMKYYSLLTSIFLEQFFGEIMTSLPAKSDLPIFFLIDEASSLYFNNLQLTISNIRKYKAGILAIYQSWNQIVDQYGAPVAKAITENCFARVHMPGQPIQVAQELETTLGKFEYLDEKSTRHTRSLMTANEIRESKDSIILCGNNPAIKTPTIPYFHQFRLNQLTKIAPYEPINKLPFTQAPIITI
jgi:type IV secretion system protein VirD4